MAEPRMRSNVAAMRVFVKESAGRLDDLGRLIRKLDEVEREGREEVSHRITAEGAVPVDVSILAILDIRDDMAAIVTAIRRDLCKTAIQFDVELLDEFI